MINFLQTHKPLIEILAQIATIIVAFSVPFAIFLFFREKQKQRKENELQTYTDLANEYRNYLKLCLEHPELQVYDFNPNTHIKLNEEQKTKQLIIFEILVSMFESAFFQYQNQTSEFKAKQWSGWVEYIQEWCKREDFRLAWEEHLGSQFDKDFLNHMNNIFKGLEDKNAEKSNKSQSI